MLVVSKTRSVYRIWHASWIRQVSVTTVPVEVSVVIYLYWRMCCFEWWLHESEHQTHKVVNCLLCIWTLEAVTCYIYDEDCLRCFVRLAMTDNCCSSRSSSSSVSFSVHQSTVISISASHTILMGCLPNLLPVTYRATSHSARPVRPLPSRVPSPPKKQPSILSQLSYFNVKIEVKFKMHSEA